MLDHETRRILVERWHLYYQIRDATDDGPLVRIICIQDARLPLQEGDIERIQGNQE